MKTLVTRRGAIELPAFFPDATYGALRAAGFDDAQAARVPGVVMNTFHLYQRPGAKLVKSLGGLHAFCGWPGAILTRFGRVSALFADP
jgi:queuine tRNA-ribosyltransferase